VYINKRNRTLGLWETAEGAAKAYDVAVLRYRSADCITNFTGYDIEEVRHGAGEKKKNDGEHSGNIQATFREHSGNIQGRFREHRAVLRYRSPDCITTNFTGYDIEEVRHGAGEKT
jgi:hypothetical protein